MSKMSRDFLQSVDLPQNSLYTPGNLLVVYEQGRVDGQFVQHFILADFLRNQSASSIATTTPTSNVVLVTTKQSVKHWGDIGSKLGWNLKALQDRGVIQVINLIKSQWDYLSSISKETHATTCSESVPEPDQSLQKCKGSDAQLVSATDGVNLKVLYDLISTSLESFPSSSSKLLLVEDLSAILYQLSSSDGERTLMTFLCKIKRLAKSTNTSLLTLFHSDEAGGDHEGTKFAKLVSQSVAEVCISVVPLFTGFSPHLSGHMHIRSKVKAKSGSGWSSKSCQYKLEERNVRVNFI